MYSIYIYIKGVFHSTYSRCEADQRRLLLQHRPPRCFGDFNAPQVKDYCCCTRIISYYIHTTDRHRTDLWVYRDPLEKKKTVMDYIYI